MAIQLATAAEVLRRAEPQSSSSSGAAANDKHPPPQPREANFEPREIERSVAALEKAMRHLNRRIHLNYNQALNRVIVKVVDGGSDKVIREIPTAEIQRLMARIRETIGVLVDEQR